MQYEAARIEAGVPRLGVDIDERTIPQEAFLERDAVSFTKGCFLGQELVCRIDTRGHVNRYLRLLRLPTATVVARPGRGGDRRRHGRRRGHERRDRARTRCGSSRSRWSAARSSRRRRLCVRWPDGEISVAVEVAARLGILTDEAGAAGGEATRSVAVPPMRHGELVHDREADAGADLAARRAAGRVEPLEDPARSLRSGMPGPSSSTRTSTVPSTAPDVDPDERARVLQRVLHEVGDDLREPLRVDLGVDGVSGRELEPYAPLGGRRCERVDGRSTTTSRASTRRVSSENSCASSRARSSRSATSRSSRRASVEMITAAAGAVRR